MKSLKIHSTVWIKWFVIHPNSKPKLKWNEEIEKKNNLTIIKWIRFFTSCNEPKAKNENHFPNDNKSMWSEIKQKNKQTIGVHHVYWNVHPNTNVYFIRASKWVINDWGKGEKLLLLVICLLYYTKNVPICNFASNVQPISALSRRMVHISHV